MLSNKDGLIIDISDCHDNTMNCYYAGVHRIDFDKYKKMIQDYFHTYDLPQPKIVELIDLDLSQDCNTNCLTFSMNPVPTNDNADIEVGVGAIPDNNWRYSIQLIRGLVHLYAIDSLAFSKAWNGNEVTAVFEARRGGYTYYYGDLTSQFPIL